MTPCRYTGLGVLWAYRRAGVWLFLALLVIMVGERRLGDLHYMLYSLGSLELGFYADAIDGDEVTLRLVAVDDASPPTAPAPASPLVRAGAPLICADIPPRSIESPAPRGPPAPSSALP